MARVVLLDVVPGPDGGLELVAHHHAGPLGGGPPGEQHHARPGVGEGTLQTQRGGVRAGRGRDIDTANFVRYDNRYIYF